MSLNTNTISSEVEGKANDYPDYQQNRICKNIGMDDTIAKPVKREDILKAFDRTLGAILANFSQPVKLTA